MFSFFRRAPKNCDEAFADLSVMLWQHDSKPTLRRETLDPENLISLWFEQASKLSPMVKKLEMSLGTAAVLAVNGENLCFPIAKVMKYLDNGSEDSTYLFGYIGINGPPEAAG